MSYFLRVTLGLGFAVSNFGLVLTQAATATQAPTSGKEAVTVPDPNTSLLIEAFYRYQVTDRIGITPGVIVITNPEHNDANGTTYVGVVRTTFSF